VRRMSNVRVSLAAALALGLKNGRFLKGARPGTLNILLSPEGGCRANCAYCGLARGRVGSERTFIRVAWPEYELGAIKERLGLKEDLCGFRRICLAMVTSATAFKDLCYLLEQFVSFGLPLSALVGGRIGREELEVFKRLGCDRLGVGLDCAQQELFRRHRGEGVGGPHRWEDYWRLIEEGLEVFGPGRVGIHLIVGLGETEQEMARAIQKAVDLGARVHLFSFCPEPGSMLEYLDPPPIGQYRRVQLAHFLIEQKLVRQEGFRYNETGQILDFGYDPEEFVATGEPFRTSGCPGYDGQVACNRPFGNERPSGPIRNFPYPPGADEIAAIRSELNEGLE